MHSLLEDLQFIVKLCKQGAFAKRSRNEAPLQLVGDVVTRSNFLLGVGRLRQQLQKCLKNTIKTKKYWKLDY